MKQLNNITVFTNVYKDFDYITPYNTTIISRYPLTGNYNVLPVVYADSLHDEVLDKFRNALCDTWAMLYVAQMPILPQSIGFVQYKRFFTDLTDDPQQCTFAKGNLRFKMDWQFCHCHDANEWKIVEEYINSTKYAEAYKVANDSCDNRFHNMFVLPKDKFLEMMDMVRNFMYFYIDKHGFKSDEDFERYFPGTYQRRMLGSHILERLISVYAKYLELSGIQLIEQEIHE